MDEKLPLLAWTVEIDYLSCVVFATTKSKAQYIAVKGYWEAYGQRKNEWPRAVAWRAKCYDNSRLKNEKIQKGWCEDYVMNTI